MFNEEQTTLIQEAMWFYYLNQSMPKEDWKDWSRVQDEINELLTSKPSPPSHTECL